MLPKDKRVPRKMFSEFLRGTKTLKNNIFFVRIKDVQENSSRFSFTVSKKVSKSAVTRNRMRRIGYRLIKDMLRDVKPGTIWNFSFLKVPKDENEVKFAINSILKDSKQLKNNK